jgi:hypothetical protein
MPNSYDPDYDEVREDPGFRARRARVGYALRSERLGLSVWELPPGEAAYPYRLDDDVPYNEGLEPPVIGDVDPA